MCAKKWGKTVLGFTGCILLIVITITVLVDPYFHYHKPIPSLYYELRQERYCNNGILRQFDYDSIIAGTSMTENFKTSEYNKLFTMHSVKVPLQGGTYKEVNDYIRMGLKYNKRVKRVLRGLDYGLIIEDANALQYNDYPDYLYDDNIINDINYWLSTNTVKNLLIDLLKTLQNGGGIESFDEYGYWSDRAEYGIDTVRASVDYDPSVVKEESTVLSADEITTIKENIKKNVIDVANEHPEVEFDCFVTPYSIFYWDKLHRQGEVERQIDSEAIMISMILDCENIHLYSFNNNYDLTTNLDNYTDEGHYGGWVNTQILNWIKEDRHRITKENWEAYLAKEKEFYMNYDYDSLWKR